jgi:FkbM family methyltransferase
MFRPFKETRRFAFQVGNLVRHGCWNPYGHTRRTRKPRLLKRKPELEIDSPLAFVVAELGRSADEFFFVQIGAFDGISDGWFRELIVNNRWHGILVEPQPEAFRRLQQTYADQPQLKFRNVAIGRAAGEATMYTLRTGASQVTSFDYQHLVRHLKRTADIIPIRVPCLTLHELLAEAGFRCLDLLQIDAEGFDAEIIRSIDFGALKPSIIRYEHRNLLSRDHDRLLEMLAGQGYRFILEDGNTIACLTRSLCQNKNSSPSGQGTKVRAA